MGSACCVAARDKTITSGMGSEVMHRNARHSPTWSFRWDNRGRVAGEETSVTWFSDGISGNDGSDIKHESAYASEEGSPLDSFPRRTWQKSPLSEAAAAGNVRTPTSDRSISRNVSMDVSLEQIKESIEPPAVSYPSPTKLSLSVPSTSSLTTSPLSSQSHLYPTSSTTPKWPRHSPGHPLLRQVSDSQIPGLMSLNAYSVREERPVIPPWRNESIGGSRFGSSDGWSVHAFTELMATSHKERWSFDNDSLGFSHEKITRSNSRMSASSIDLQTCGVCSKLLSEFTVVAVLTCGHVYHAECLENITAESNKYDPACPACTLGEKKTLKLSEKALKSEMESKAKNNKRSRKRFIDSNLGGNSFVSDRLKSGGYEGKDPKLASSSSMKGSSLGKPFLRRHFSFGSKGSRSLSENHSTWTKGLFWAKSSKT